MDKFDRMAQRKLLQDLYDVYPDELTNEGTESQFSHFPDEKHG